MMSILVRTIKPDKRTLSSLKRLYKVFDLKYLSAKLHRYYNILTINRNHQKTIKKLEKKNKYKVAFFMIIVAHWKYNNVYKLMLSDDRFEPVVVICPMYEFGSNELRVEMQKSKSYCLANNYNYYLPIDEISGKYIDIKNILKPDIVFFTEPYRTYTHKYYYIDHFIDTFTCFVPYSIRQENGLTAAKWDTDLQNLVVRNYYESSIHLKLARKYARNSGSNVIITGYPSIDQLGSVGSPKEGIWKKQDSLKKKIIWAPHWTIKGYQKTGLDWSGFIEFSEIMLKIAYEYKDKIQFAFKPHPNLRVTLSKEKLWGVVRTEAYFNKWKEFSNCQLNEADYVDLFVSSDALIHDCGSFMIEYLALDKPVLYLLNGGEIEKRFNEFGKMAYQCHYKASAEDGIKRFIEQVILNNNDTLKDERIHFREQNLVINGESASQNIIDDICITLNAN